MKKNAIVSFALLFLVAFNLNATAADDNPEVLRTIRPWGRETVENTKSFFSQYDHIVLVRIESDRWDSHQPPKLSDHHYVGKVTKVYKGSGQVGARVAFVTFLDGPAPRKPAEVKGALKFLLAKDLPDSEFPVDTGELLPFRKDHEPALKYFYQNK